MISSSAISAAVEDMLNSDPQFNDFDIERGEIINDNPDRCPWIGIYRGRVDFDPETLGNGPDHWTGKPLLRLVIQAANFESGAATEDELDEHVEAVIRAIIQDTTLRGMIDMIEQIGVSYSYIVEDESTIFFQAAIIEMTLEVSAE